MSVLCVAISLTTLLTYMRFRLFCATPKEREDNILVEGRWLVEDKIEIHRNHGCAPDHVCPSVTAARNQSTIPDLGDSDNGCSPRLLFHDI